jgi:methionyl-tRNA synthetase
MIDTLILSYLEGQSHGPKQVGYLTGMDNHETYFIRVEYENHSHKRDYQKLKDTLRELIEGMRLEHNFEFDNFGTSYLADMNIQAFKRIDELVARESGDKAKIILRKVTEIGPEEKKLLMRRHSRRSSQSYR